jgi:hypothetical protein
MEKGLCQLSVLLRRYIDVISPTRSRRLQFLLDVPDNITARSPTGRPVSVTDHMGEMCGKIRI